MKAKIILLSLFLGIQNQAFSQNSTLTPQGVMFPQMTTVQINALTGQAKGTMVFDNSLNLMKYWDGTAWQAMTNTSSSGAWQSSGNDQITTNTGNVGIGQANPSYKLDVLHENSSENRYGVRVKSSSGSSFIQLDGANLNSGILFGNNNTKSWAIQSNGDEFNISGRYRAIGIEYNNGLVTLVKGARFGYYGSILGNFVFGTTSLGSSNNNTYSQPVILPYSFPNANYIVTFSQSGTSFDDFFQLQVRDKTKDGFTIWAKRRDSNSGWGQILNVDWIVMAP